MPVVAINKQTGALEGVPDIITRGFVMEDSQALLADGARLLDRGRRAGERRGAHRSGADQGEAARRAAPLLPQAFGPAAVRAARHHGDLTREWIDRVAPRQRIRRRRAVRRRAHLDHRRSPATSRPIRSGSSAPGSHAAPANFAGRVGAFLAELSFQLFGYAVVPHPRAPGRHRLELLLVPRRSTPPARRSPARALLFGCAQRVPQPRRSARSTSSGKPFRAGGYVGEWLARGAVRIPESHRLGHRHPHADLPGDHHVDAVLVRPVLRARSSAPSTAARRARSTSFREWREERRREKQRREVIAKHTKKGAPCRPRSQPAAAAAAGVRRSAAQAEAARQSDDARRRRGRAPAPARRSAARKSFAPPKPPKVSMPAPPLPLADPEPTAKAPAERRKGDYALPPLALLDAPKTERKIDERELMDGARLLEEKCREFSVEGSVVQIHPGPGRHDVRVQARRRREVLEDHRPGRRSVPRDAGRVGAHRSHSRQVDRRHPDSESQPRADLAARAARVRGLPPLDVEADASRSARRSTASRTSPTSRRCRTC